MQRVQDTTVVVDMLFFMVDVLSFILSYEYEYYYYYCLQYMKSS